MSDLGELLKSWFPHLPPPAYLTTTIDASLLGVLLENKPTRLRHILAVASFAQEISPRLGDDRLVQTALSHDIGYADALRRTGFHPLDGAVFLAHRGADPEVIHAVLHHTGAREEAKHLLAVCSFYERLPYQPTILDDAITFCDTQTSPLGARVAIEERIAEIKQRYGQESVVSQVMDHMTPEFIGIRRKLLQTLTP